MTKEIVSGAERPIQTSDTRRRTYSSEATKAHYTESKRRTDTSSSTYPSRQIDRHTTVAVTPASTLTPTSSVVSDHDSKRYKVTNNAQSMRQTRQHYSRSCSSGSTDTTYRDYPSPVLPSSRHVASQWRSWHDDRCDHQRTYQEGGVSRPRGIDRIQKQLEVVDDLFPVYAGISVDSSRRSGRNDLYSRSETISDRESHLWPEIVGVGGWTDDVKYVNRIGRTRMS